MDVRRVQRFTEQEAKAKVGHTVRSLVEFYRVPLGSKGRVIDVYKMAEGSFDVVIQWNLPKAPEPFYDRFAKSTYEQLLSEDYSRSSLLSQFS